jgi:hypothetical protein
MFFGDGDHSFALKQPQITELENKYGAVSAICGRVFARQFSQAEIAETIRLALIGAGEHPKRAAELIALYVTDRPLNEFYSTALAICEAVWFDEPHEKASK